MSGRVYTAEDIGSDITLEPDFAIIGSGAGGAVSAAVLSQAGASVVVLEEGGFYTRKDFNMDEARAVRNLYQERGNRATEDLSIIILQGRSVGGSTTINWTTSFRTPRHVLEHWADVHGVEGFSYEDLESAFESVEERLSIEPFDERNMNANNRVLWRGATKLGYEPQISRRNVVNCMHSGYCGMGCPTNAKQAMHMTYLPDAVSAGASIYANVRAQRLVADGSRITEIQASVMDESRYTPGSTRVTVRPKNVILAGGAINSPSLLMRSQLADVSGQLGKRTCLHPVPIVVGFYEDPVEAFYGAPQSVSLHKGVELATDERMGFFVETAPVHPLLASISATGYGDTHTLVMGRLAHMSALIALHVDGFDPEEKCGTVSITDAGRTVLNYEFTPRFWKTFRYATRFMAEIHLAAGAQEVATTHEEPVIVKSTADLEKIEQAEYGPLKQLVASAHQMGGCRMGGSPETSVVSSELKHWSYDNLWIIDGSVFPTAAGVNPSETIYAMATLAASRIAAA